MCVCVCVCLCIHNLSQSGTTEHWVNDRLSLNDASSIGYTHGEK